MTVVDVPDGDELREIMKKNQNKLLVLEFKAQWSEPCKYMKKVLDGSDGLASTFQADVGFYALDIAVFKQFAQRMRVEALPTFLLLKGYKVMARVVGVDKQELKSSIIEHKDNDGPGLREVNPEEDIDNPTRTLWAWLKSLF